MSVNSVETFYLGCDCGGVDHVIVLSVHKPDGVIQDKPELLVAMQLNSTFSFWRRLQVAFRYLFNMQQSGNVNCWGETLLDERGVSTLEMAINSFNLANRKG
jgi:hypothetical protein